jgi:hypothetical protein
MNIQLKFSFKQLLVSAVHGDAAELELILTMMVKNDNQYGLSIVFAPLRKMLMIKDGSRFIRNPAVFIGASPQVTAVSLEKLET